MKPEVDRSKNREWLVVLLPILLFLSITTWFIGYVGMRGAFDSSQTNEQKGEIMEKYAVVFTNDGSLQAVVFTNRENALEFATEQRLGGVADLELFREVGPIQIQAVVEPANGQTKKPKRAVSKPGKVKKTSAKKKAKAGSRAGFPKLCIAMGCRKKNKGPRFRFLCLDHISASAKQVEKWKEGE